MTNEPPPLPIHKDQDPTTRYWQQLVLAIAAGAAVGLILVGLFWMFLRPMLAAKIGANGTGTSGAISEGKGVLPIPGKSGDADSETGVGDTDDGTEKGELDTAPRTTDDAAGQQSTSSETKPPQDGASTNSDETRKPKLLSRTINRSASLGGGVDPTFHWSIRQVHPRRPSVATPLRDALSIGESFKTIVYVIDKSPSMLGGMSSAPQFQKTGQRFDRVKQALKASIGQLQADQSFAVIFFDTTAESWPYFRAGAVQAMRPATPQNARKASFFIDAVTFGSGTNPSQAMHRAISAHPELIVLLSDGEFQNQIVAAITADNQRHRSGNRIDCVGLDEVVASLQSIADQNKGVFYYAQ